MTWKPLCKHQGRLDGKLAIVTGANTGIGLETVAELARRGCKVVLACRSKERMANAVKTILNRYGVNSDEHNKINFVEESKDDLSQITEDLLVQMVLDLSSIVSIKNFVENFETIEGNLDFLINNAGLVSTSYKQSEDGFELTMGTNHFGHCILTDLLIPRMKEGSRIIMVSSKANYWAKISDDNIEDIKDNFRAMRSYSNSKLANVVYALYLKDKLQSKGILTASLHPGVVKTDIGREMPQFVRASMLFFAGWAHKTAWEGCQTTMECVLSPDLVNGAYYSGCEVLQPNKITEKNGFIEQFMQKTYERIGQTENGKQLMQKLNKYD